MRGERRERREASPRTEADTTETKHATDGVEGGRRRRTQLVRQSHTFIGGRTRRSQDVRKHSLPSDPDRREFLPNICGRCPRRRCCLRFVVGASALWLQSADPPPERPWSSSSRVPCTADGRQTGGVRIIKGVLAGRCLPTKRMRSGWPAVLAAIPCEMLRCQLLAAKVEPAIRRCSARPLR